jgi:DNA-binding CsgD family transcriptional regulator
MPSQRESEVAPGISDPRFPRLVGRDEEVAVCGALLARRDAAGIVVMGASGVGKTRLATELLRVAEGAGDAPLRVTATEAGRAIPLGAFAHLLPGNAVEAPTLLQLLRLARAAIAVREDGRRTALLVDDAHLLDSASAMLVQQLVAAREATVVATVRTGEPVSDAVVALWKDHGCEYLELQPLSLDETGVLVEALVGGEVDGQTKHRLWDASRGVPLIVRELVQDGLERRLLEARAGLWRWRGPLRAGRRLRELIQARIGQLDDRERELLELVALGEPLGPSLLDRSEAVAADNLTRRGVLVADRDRRRLELRLAHPLFGESVRAGMPATRGSALQRRLADAFETRGLRRSGDLLRFVVWRLDSGGTATAELLLRAAMVSEVSLDPVLAERLARAAVEAGAGLPAERAVARALIGQERFVEAEALLSSLTTRADTEEERASVGLAHARNLVVGLGRGAEAETALANAMKLVSDAELRRELELVRCWVLSRRGRSAEAAEAALALVAGGADRNFRVRAAGIAVHALVWAGRTDDALALVDRWQPYADEKDAGHGPLLSAQYCGGRALALLCNGRLEEAEIAADEAYTRFVGDRTTEATALMALVCALAALHRGHLTAARRWLREASELLREADPTGSLSLALSLTAQARGQAGDAHGATEAATEAERARRPGEWLNDVDVLLGRAWAAASAGALTEAQQKAHMAADLAEERGATLAVKSAHDLLRLGDPHQAAARLARFAGEVQGSLGAACAEHAEAIVSGDARRLEHAAAQFADMGALLWAAEADSAAASLYRETGRDASARAAAARAAALLARCEGARTPALALAGPVEELTAREREIATLAARGASNREIAARLVVSVRTVENHLQRAYRKLGVRNRGELPRVLHVPE